MPADAADAKCLFSRSFIYAICLASGLFNAALCHTLWTQCLDASKKTQAKDTVWKLFICKCYSCKLAIWHSFGFCGQCSKLRIFKSDFSKPRHGTSRMHVETRLKKKYLFELQKTDNTEANSRKVLTPKTHVNSKFLFR